MQNFLQILNSTQSDVLTDKQYLEEYIRAFYKIYSNDIACIKNTISQYIAASPGFSKLMGLTSTKIILMSDSDLPCKIAEYADVFTNYDKKICSLKAHMTFLDINEYANGIGVYTFHKRPIINSSTNNVVGILYLGEVYKANNMVKTFLDMHQIKNDSFKSFNTFNSFQSKVNIGAKQAEVLFCVLLGLKEEKVIAEFINNIKNSDYTKKTINNAMMGLYSKFNATSRESLIQLALSENYHHIIPTTLIKHGSYLISSSVNAYAPVRLETNRWISVN